ncbi:hypothetical protein NC651_030784 [Populus alba x Populus x berolinensis]|uniref:Uncharacterized protein n=1 Tax=Populus alba x Populus x berolinensis TaxID=444605 RepID=A0AAD6LZA0_9ROSI|nr:hypothetical protein NC651_030784 [Populus alba x Populus x berolinensis]KAJ6975852.1 hypothetical protein NC653_031626 [Populus alba x Populus x berolinensis]
MYWIPRKGESQGAQGFVDERSQDCGKFMQERMEEGQEPEETLINFDKSCFWEFFRSLSSGTEVHYWRILPGARW